MRSPTGDPLATAARLPTTAWRTGPRGAGSRTGARSGAAPRVRAARCLRTLSRARARCPRARDRWAFVTGSRHRSASGAQLSPRPGAAPPAATNGCAQWWWGRGAPPKSSVAPFQGSRCSPQGVARFGARSPRPQRSSLRRLAPSRSQVAATLPRSCSIPGRCWAAPTCVRLKRPYADGWLRRRSCAAQQRAAGSSSLATPRSGRCRHWFAGTRWGSPTPSSPTAKRSGFRRHVASRYCVARPTTSGSSFPDATCPRRTEQLGPVPVPGGDDQQLVLRADVAAGAELATALSVVQGERSVRKDTGRVRVQIDPVGFG